MHVIRTSPSTRPTAHPYAYGIRVLSGGRLLVTRQADRVFGAFDPWTCRLTGDLGTDPAALAAVTHYLESKKA